jgi:hypothetical protein
LDAGLGIFAPCGLSNVCFVTSGLFNMYFVIRHCMYQVGQVAAMELRFKMADKIGQRKRAAAAAALAPWLGPEVLPAVREATLRTLLAAGVTPGKPQQQQQQRRLKPAPLPLKPARWSGCLHQQLQAAQAALADVEQHKQPQMMMQGTDTLEWPTLTMSAAALASLGADAKAAKPTPQQQKQQKQAAHAGNADIQALLAALRDDAATSPASQNVAASKKKKKETAAQREAKKQQKLRLQRLQEQQQQRSTGSSRSGSDADDGSGGVVGRHLAETLAAALAEPGTSAVTQGDADAGAVGDVMAADWAAGPETDDATTARATGDGSAAPEEGQLAAAGKKAGAGSREQSSSQQVQTGTQPPPGSQSDCCLHSLYETQVWQDTAQEMPQGREQVKAGTAEQMPHAVQGAAGALYQVQQLAAPPQPLQQPQVVEHAFQQHQEFPSMPQVMMEVLSAAARSTSASFSHTRGSSVRAAMGAGQQEPAAPGVVEDSKQLRQQQARQHQQTRQCGRGAVAAAAGIAAIAARDAPTTSPPLVGMLHVVKPAGSSPSSGVKGPKLCVSCGLRRRNMLLMPCEHMVLCNACADVDSCPSCGQPCKQRVKVHGM